MKKLRKIKFSCLIALFLIIVGNILFNKRNEDKIKEIKNLYMKTNLDNVYLLKTKKIDLAFINKNKIKEIKNLDNIGEIKKNTPILIFKNDKYGYIDTEGNTLIPLKYQGIGVFNDRIALAKKNNKIGVLDIEGNEIIPYIYDEIYIGQNKEFIVKENMQYFSFDLKEKKYLPIDSLQKINDKLFIFSKNEKLGIMDYIGNVLILPEYDEISTFIDKLFIGSIENKYSLFNLKNEKITDDYDFIEQIGNNEYRAGNSDKGDYAFLSQEIITEDKYENIYKINENIFIGKLKNNKTDIFNLKLKTITSISNEEVEKYIEKIESVN